MSFRATAGGRSGHSSRVLDILLSATDLDGRPLAEKAIRDECMTLLFGGHETTAGSLTWTFALLAKNPDKRGKLLAEVDAALGGRRAPVYEEVDRLEYVRMAFEEAMRFYTMWLVLFREAAAEDVLGGYRFPKGSLVAFCGYTTQRDPRWWPEPERYEPERHTKVAAGALSRAFLY
ncbi:MAG: cytochrome P450, partial [Candidatus Binatia bacterium]